MLSSSFIHLTHYLHPFLASVNSELNSCTKVHGFYHRSGTINRLDRAAEIYGKSIDKMKKETPFGVPYQPNIWGAGWSIQRFGMQQYYLNKTWPDYFPIENMMNALNFILGCHPGENNASFVSGVGAKSVLVAYGVNRGEWSFIPGGSVSGTALIRPDFPELLEWPYLWQQTEYVMGGGATHFMFLALAAEHHYSSNDTE